MGEETKNAVRHGTRRVVRLMIFAPVAIGIGGLAVMLLWNWLVPGIVGWHAINFWQAIGILVLSRLLFGGMHGGHRRHHHGRGWRRRVIERWEKMTPEEKEAFRRGMRPLGCGEKGD